MRVIDDAHLTLCADTALSGHVAGPVEARNRTADQVVRGEVPVPVDAAIRRVLELHIRLEQPGDIRAISARAVHRGHEFLERRGIAALQSAAADGNELRLGNELSRVSAA